MSTDPGAAMGRVTAQDRIDLSRIGSGPEDTAYYADFSGVDWNRLKDLERRGLAATRNESDWWRTAAGRRALAAETRGGRDGE